MPEFGEYHMLGPDEGFEFEGVLGLLRACYISNDGLNVAISFQTGPDAEEDVQNLVVPRANAKLLCECLEKLLRDVTPGMNQ